MKNFFDYFEETIEFPKRIIDNPIPYGEYWVYVSSTFLNGLINYCDPIKCFVIDRYTSDEKIVEIDNKSAHKWEKLNLSKKELKQKVIGEELTLFHTKLDCFKDDIIILAEIESIDDEFKNHFIFFWFDMDVSDCCIGKFQTNDSKEEVIQSLYNWLDGEKESHEDCIIDDNFDNGIVNYTELPLSFLQGWIKF